MSKEYYSMTKRQEAHIFLKLSAQSVKYKIWGNLFVKIDIYNERL